MLNIDGTYKNIDSCKVNIDGVYKDVDTIHGNIDGVWKELYSSAGLYELLADVTVSVSAVTSVNIASLNLTKDDDYMLVGTVIGGGTSCDTALYANANTTGTNYYSQYFNVSATAKAMARQNTAAICAVTTSDTSSFIAHIKLTASGRMVALSAVSIRCVGANINYHERYVASTFTMTSITSLTLTSLTASMLGVGSRFQLYKIGGA